MPARPDDAGRQAAAWYYWAGETMSGPYDARTLRRLAASGQIASSTLIWKEGMREPVAARKVRGLLPGRDGSEAPAGALAPKEPPPTDALPLETMMRLYDLLRDEPMFVDWYVRTREKEAERWAQLMPPSGIMWTRFGAALALALLVALTGVGVFVSAMVGLWINWKNHGDQQRYKRWRSQVDPLVNALGLAQSLSLIDRAPKLGSIRQFIDFTQGAVGAGSQAARSRKS